MDKHSLELTLMAVARRKCPFVRTLNSIGVPSILLKITSFIRYCPYLKRCLNNEVCIAGNKDRKKIEESSKLFEFERFCEEKVKEKKKSNTYRVFYRIGRLANKYPTAEYFPHNQDVNNLEVKKNVAVWCSNDYLGLSRHPKVVDAAKKCIEKYGVGSGGTRNISGNNVLHEQLEDLLAKWYHKDSGLIFTSCYVANTTTLYTLACMLPGCIIFSDEGNHASMIEGIRNSRCEKHIFKHNDADDLERIISTFDKSIPKIVAFESINSMDGSIAPIKRICDIAHKYGAFTFLDEVHAVGLYGQYGSGLSEEQNCLDSIDIISGTMGKAVGGIGGFIVGNSSVVDMIRSYGSGLIFTTSLPPIILSAAIQSINILKSTEGNYLRQIHQSVAGDVRKRILQEGFPLFPSVSHIIPILVGNAHLCKDLSYRLLDKYNIYVQAINYPTVKSGTERLRIAPTPSHSVNNCDQLLSALKYCWKEIGLNLMHQKCENHQCDCKYACALV